ncbi:hypothetical protein Btru_077469 [Bulinus truncatus]|nr:hypothetical protein Btru_077469 [Bulinus truncatus]
MQSQRDRELGTHHQLKFFLQAMDSLDSKKQLLLHVQIGLSILLCLFTMVHCQNVYTQDSQAVNANLTCEDVYLEYIKAVNNFTHCELRNAQPFRLCSKCIEHYELAFTIYNEQLTDPNLGDCYTRFLLSDNIQIIPSVQKNMDSIWTQSACNGYATNYSVNLTTGLVTYSVYPDIIQFFELYENFSRCMNNTPLVYFSIDGLDVTPQNVCTVCHDMYAKLNSHFNNLQSHVSTSNDKDDSNNNVICMDVVDIMNHTRYQWSMKLNCSRRTGDTTAVIAITCVVAVTPIFFYALSKVTGREGFKKLYKQKRLTLSSTLSVSAPSTETGSGPRWSQRLLTFTS